MGACLWDDSDHNQWEDESAFPGLDLSALLIFYDLSDLGSLILIIPIRNASLDFKPSHTLPLSALFRLNPQIKFINYFDAHIRAVTKGWETKVQSDPVITDTGGAIESVLVKGVFILSRFNLEKMSGFFPSETKTTVRNNVVSALSRCL